MTAETVRDEAVRPVAGTVAVVIAVVAWGGASVLGKAVEELDGLALSTLRLWMGAVATCGLFVARGGRIDVRLLRACLAGGITFALDMALFFSALKHTTVANATVIGALQPALLLFLTAPLFGERLRLSDVAWTGLALLGVAIVVFASAGSPVWSPTGDLLAVGSLFAWTAYFIVSKQARRTLGALEYSAGMTLVAAVVITPVALLSGVSLRVEHLVTWLVIGVLAVGPGGASHLLINWAHPHVTIVRSSLLTLAIPVVASVLAAVFLDEPLTALQVVGGLVVIGALAAVVLGSIRATGELLDQPAPTPTSS